MKIIIDEIYSKQALVDALHAGEVTVEFRKVNGEVRTMPCTLKETLMPLRPVTDSVPAKEPKKVNENTISVWCTDKQAWRSFRVDSVISYSTISAE